MPKKSTTTATKSNPQPPRRNQASRSRQRRQRSRMNMRVAPIAVGAQFSTYATVRTAKDGSASLCVKEVFPITGSPAGLSLAIPMCPTKWVGTRSAALAGTYQSHRPLRVSWDYIPACASTTAGSIVVGTVFAGCRLPSDDSITSLINALPATNGGSIGSVWQPLRNGVSCGRNLRANQYPLNEVSADDIPFWIVAATNGTGDLGSIVITADFTLRNPCTPGQTPPAAFNGKLNLNHSAENNTTSFELPIGSFGSPISVGQEFSFAPLSSIKNSSGSIVASPLSTFIATVSKIVSEIATFDVDKSFITSTISSVLIGRHANF